jgi:hypothetical protein
MKALEDALKIALQQWYEGRITDEEKVEILISGDPERSDKLLDESGLGELFVETARNALTKVRRVYLHEYDSNAILTKQKQY